MKLTHSVLIGLVYMACIYDTGDALQCFQCNAVSNLTECSNNFTECGPTDQCFLEMVQTDSLQTIFNAGCRYNGICDIMHSLTGWGIGKRQLSRTQRDLVICTECCNYPGDKRGPCNGRLCRQNPVLTCLQCHGVANITECTDSQCGPRELRPKLFYILLAVQAQTTIPTTIIPYTGSTINPVLTCLQCHGVANITECTDSQCGPHEQCFLEMIETESLQTVFNGGCREDTTCMVMKILEGAVGKRTLTRTRRGLIISAKCCDSPGDSNGPCNGKLLGQRYQMPTTIKPQTQTTTPMRQTHQVAHTATTCRPIFCVLNCGNPPKYKHDANGCNICECQGLG